MKKTTKTAEFRKLEEFALERGASGAKVFSARLVAVDERVRMKCQIPLCPHFGQCLTCPPNVPTVEEFGKALLRYHKAILLQTRTPLAAPMDESERNEALEFLEGKGAEGGTGAEGKKARQKSFDDMKLSSIKLHELVNEVEGRAMALGFPYALGLIGGDCMLCHKCAGPGNACRRPYQARPSMEGVGIDVVKTSISAGLPFDIPPKTEIVWSGLVLID